MFDAWVIERISLAQRHIYTLAQGQRACFPYIKELEFARITLDLLYLVPCMLYKNILDALYIGCSIPIALNKW